MNPSKWQKIKQTTTIVVDNPELIWEGIKDPYVKAWAEKEYGEAIGRGICETGTFVVGISKAGLLNKLLSSMKSVDKLAKTLQL